MKRESRRKERKRRSEEKEKEEQAGRNPKKANRNGKKNFPLNNTKYAEIKGQNPLSAENILILNPLVNTFACAAGTHCFTPKKNLIPAQAGQVSGIQLIFIVSALRKI